MSDDARTFRYHDGKADVHGDPTALRRGLLLATGGRLNALLRDYYALKPGTSGEARERAEAVSARAASSLIPAVREVFGLADFEPATGGGATDDDADRVMHEFRAYLWAVKKKRENWHSTAPPTAAASSAAPSPPKSDSA